jgi:uncharacterized protein (TIGR00369 family)
MSKQPNSFHCFICGVKNVGGVHVNFYEGIDAQGRPEVAARFTGRHDHQGYPGRMHGGVITGILDETIGRAISIGQGEQTQIWGVTAELEVKFLLPVPLDVELTAKGRVVELQRRSFIGTGEILLPDGMVAASAKGRFVQLTLEQIGGAGELDALGWKVYPDEVNTP